ncbi:hypothetical protein MTO96_035225 [Rhipicephalus appendiculatus]
MPSAVARAAAIDTRNSGMQPIVLPLGQTASHGLDRRFDGLARTVLGRVREKFGSKWLLIKGSPMSAAWADLDKRPPWVPSSGVVYRATPPLPPHPGLSAAFAASRPPRGRADISHLGRSVTRLSDSPLYTSPEQKCRTLCACARVYMSVTRDYALHLYR